MSVRIRPGDGATEPVFPFAAHPDDDRPANSQQHIRSVFEDELAQDDAAGAGWFQRPSRDGKWLNALASRRPPWSRLVAVTVLAAVAVLLLGGLATRLATPATPAPQPAVAAPTAATPAETPSATAPPTATHGAGQMTAVSWQGAALPVSQVAGPRVFTETRAYGFARDPLGAALAAVHISTHLDPYTGPKVFGPAIENQVVDARPDLLATTTATYETVARQQGYSDDALRQGRPVLAPTGSIQSWRIQDYRPERATVQLLVATPVGRRVVYEVPVEWTGGDWSVSLAGAREGTAFTVVRPDSTKEFNTFTTGGNQ